MRETALLFLVLAGCGDSTSPQLQQLSTEFELCFKPEWIAIRNTGSAWTLISVPTPQAPFGTVRVSASVTQLTSMAFGSGGSADVYHLSREELGALRCEYDPDLTPNRPISGTVAGIPATAPFVIRYGGIAATGTGPGAFSTTIKDTTATILASYDANTEDLRASGYLVVHGFRSNGAATFPPLDFSSPSVRVLDSAQLTVAQAAAVEPGLRLTNFFTSRLVANLDIGLTSLSNTYYFALSGAQPGDLYGLELHSGNKELEWYYAGLSGPRSLSFPPDVLAIDVASLETSPCLRMRAELPVQTELSSGVRILFQVSQGRGVNNAAVFISEAFRSGANAWVAEVPEIDLPGTQCVWSSLPVSGVVTTIYTTAYDGNIRLALNAPPAAGDILRSASATRPGP